MFGFLKKKLKKAVEKFSSSAEKDVKEEKVEDKAVIDKAKKAEEKIVKKVVKKKEVKKPVKEKTVKKKVPEVTKTEKKPTPKKKVPEVQKEEKKVSKEPVKEKPEEPAEKESKGFFGKLKEKITGKEEEKPPVVKEKKKEKIDEKPVEDKAPEVEEIKEEVKEEKKVEEIVEPEEEITDTAEEPEEKPSFLGKLKESFTKKTLSEEKFNELFWELELAMLENNVAVEVIEKIKADLQDELTTGKVNRLGIEDMIMARLRQSVEEVLDVAPLDLIKTIKKAEKPFVICMIGVNGSGKTTSLAKVVHKLQQEKLSVVVAASDTFRAAAIDQLKEHTDKLGVKLISQGYNADPAAVAFDAIAHAKANKIDVVLIDTAGRLHSNTNLMQELEKVVRVNNPDLKIFVGESITGNDCVEQAKVFDSLVGIDALILSKADVDEKGGAAISVSYVTGKPILYIGTGQTYDDLERFEKEKIIAAMGL